ncbi:hypothetical protein ACFSTC_47135 [Nonomuraea ferruginea]
MAAFMKANPGVTVKSTDQQPCFDPKTFGPKLAAAARWRPSSWSPSPTTTT